MVEATNKHSGKPVFGIDYNNGYRGSLPRFYEPEDFPQFNVLVDNWDAIKAELLHHKGFRAMYSDRSSSSEGWKGMYLNNYGLIYRSNLKHFPILTDVLKQIPDVVFVAFSALEPMSQINSHWGDSNTTVRGVLGIEVPGVPPDCGLTVGGEMRAWKEGGLLLFNECHLHSATNMTDKRRIILSVDMIRPEFSGLRSVICANVLACQTVAIIRQRFGFRGQTLSKLLIKIFIPVWMVFGWLTQLFGRP